MCACVGPIYTILQETTAEVAGLSTRKNQDWFDAAYQRKNNSKRAYQLLKDLTTVKQGKATTVQDRSGKCLTEERQILNRWTEYCTELYNYKASGDPSVLNCP